MSFTEDLKEKLIEDLEEHIQQTLSEEESEIARQMILHIKTFES